MNYFLSLKWKKPKYVKIIFSLMDISHLYSSVTKKPSKDSMEEFSMRNRGKSMVKLDSELKQSKDSIIVRLMTV